MRRFFKITVISLLSIALVFATGICIVSFFFKDDALKFVIESVNRQITTRIEVQSADFSVIRKFPNASVEFKNVVIYPSADFDATGFDSDHSQQMLTAESVFAEMNIIRLITGDYRITSIEVRNGNINMLTDKNGKHNFIFWKKNDDSDERAPIELQNVTLRGVEIYYSHINSNTTLSLYADRTQFNGKFSSKKYAMSADLHGVVNMLSIDNDIFIRDKTLELFGKLDVDDNVFSISKGDFSLAKIDLTVAGGFSTDGEVNLDLRFEGKQIEYNSLTSLLPDFYGQYLHDYPGSGNVNFDASVKGRADRGNSPRIEALFGMTQGQVTHRQSQISLTGLSFAGSFTNGANNNRTTSALQINNFGFNFGGEAIRGSFSMQNFARPQISLKIAGNADVEQLHRFIPGKQILSAGGMINCDMTVNMRLKRLSLSNTDDIEHLALQGTVNLNEASMFLREPEYQFSSINGTLQFGARVTTNNLSLVLNDNDFKIEGYMDHLTTYLLKRSQSVYVRANVSSQKLNVNSLLASENSSNGTNSIFPENIFFEANVDVANFSFGNFAAERMNVHLVYRPLNLEIQSLDFSTMSGNIRGSFTVANEIRSNDIRVFGATTLERVDVKQLFRAFDNFGQETLRTEHISGRFSGDFYFVAVWDYRMRLRNDLLTLEGRMELEGGELVNFEPMNSLSRFVALEELQNIRFSNMNTRVTIRDRKITFPHTDVHSSAMDISMSGEHDFDNNYSYRIKILLNELLAAKARNSKRENRENEYIEDGGRRAALHLLASGNGADFRISYDQQSARASIAEDIRNERQNLRSILNEEFGWFSRDTLVTRPATPSNSGQLRFIFDDL